MLNKLTKVTAISAIALVSQLGFAHEGYVTDNNGNFLKQGNGDCVVHGAFIDNQGCFPKPEPVAEPEPVVEPEPAPEPVLEAPPKPPAPPVMVKQSFSLSGDVLFPTNSSELNVEGIVNVADVANEINTTEGLDLKKVTVIGHADSRGRADYNQALSEARAETVANVLMSYGVDPSVIEFVGAGETQPVASNDTVIGRAQNRRVDINISGIQTTTK